MNTARGHGQWTRVVCTELLSRQSNVITIRPSDHTKMYVVVQKYVPFYTDIENAVVVDTVVMDINFMKLGKDSMSFGNETLLLL